MVQMCFTTFPSKNKPVSLESEKQNPGKVYKHLETVHCAGKSGAIPAMVFVYSVHIHA